MSQPDWPGILVITGGVIVLAAMVAFAWWYFGE